LTNLTLTTGHALANGVNNPVGSLSFS